MFNNDLKISDSEIRNATTEDLLVWLEEEEEQNDCRIHMDNCVRITKELRNRNKRR